METEAREPEMSLTFEQVWAMFQESDQQIQKSREEADWQIERLGYCCLEELVENLVAPHAVEKFNALGYRFDDIFSGLRLIIHEGSNGLEIAEFDIVLESKDSIVGVKVRSQASYNDVKDHTRSLRIFRFSRDNKGDKRKIHGALAGVIMPPSARDAALKAGLYVITQAGDTVNIDVPEGFVPKTW